MSLTLTSALSLIKDVPDFPKPGILFKDISPLLEDPNALQAIVRGLADSVSSLKPQKVAGVESRGFLLAAPVAYHLGCGLVMIRKKGKLPRRTHQATYALEYGSDQIEMHQDAVLEGERIVIVDDVLATGGTLAAAQRLVETAGGVTVGIQVLLELSALKGRRQLGTSFVKSLVVV